MPSRDPELVAEDEHREFVPLFPGDIRFELRPLFTIVRIPDIAPIGVAVAGPSPSQPHMSPIGRRGEPQARRPRRSPGDLCPVNAVLGGPNIIARLISGT